MCRFIIIFLSFVILIISSGCTPYPRYRSGGAELPSKAEPQQIRWKTRNYIKLGLIFEQYLGKPYKGKSEYEAGLDCSLFVMEVFKKYNRTLLPRTVKEQVKQGREVHRNLLRYGDLVFFKTDNYSISHVGIYVGHNQFIHASSSRGIVISNMNEKYWGERYAAARRIIE
ncbi:MAG: NlpC/P60 family protein [bacterium]